MKLFLNTKANKTSCLDYVIPDKEVAYTNMFGFKIVF
jgi:hypothetical protein